MDRLSATTSTPHADRDSTISYIYASKLTHTEELLSTLTLTNSTTTIPYLVCIRNINQ